MKKTVSLILSLICCLGILGGCGPKHIHNHVLMESNDLLCTQGGVQLMVCECGDCYKVSVAPTDHVWGEWEETLAPTDDTEGTKKRLCTKCQVEELCYLPRTDLKKLFKSYAEFFFLRGLFNSVNELSVNDVFDLIVTHDFWKGPFLWESSEYYTDTHVYRYFYEDELNEICSKYFNKTYDWSEFKTVNNPKNLFSNRLSYESDKKRIVSVLSGSDGIGGPNYFDWVFTKYEQIDESHYKIYYKTRYHELQIDPDSFESDDYKITTYKRVLTVQFKDGKFGIISHKKQ